jgi:hypothetical protein
MLLTIRTTHRPATDLGFLLHKHSEHVHTREFPFGNATVFYPETSEESCTAAVLLDVAPVNIGATLDQRRAPLKFAPGEGPAFFASYGWKPTEVRSLLHTAATLKRLSFGLRLPGTAAGSRGTEAGTSMGRRVPLLPEHRAPTVSNRRPQERPQPKKSSAANLKVGAARSRFLLTN